MTYNQKVKQSKKRQLQRRRQGSRKGYNGDIDELPTSCVGQQDANANASATAVTRNNVHHFYAHIQPRRRTKRRPRKEPKKAHIDPEIDLSLVSLLSSKELDRRFGYSRQGLKQNGLSSNSSSAASPSSSEVSNDSSTDSVPPAGKPVMDTIIKTEKKCKAHARPLAVIDYGSIELNMSGSLLDSIYKIGGSNSSARRTGRGRGRDFMFPGRRYSLEESSSPNDNIDNKIIQQETSPQEVQTMDTNKAAELAVATSSSTFSQACTVASSRSPEVKAVIASLKSMKGAPSTKRALPDRCSMDCPQQQSKKQKIANTRVLPTVDKMATTLEESISFSPFARVLFCAQDPYTIVHTNAAYSTLVQKGIVKPCTIGESFSSINQTSNLGTEEDLISKAVADHVNVASSRSPSSDQLRHVRIFPVMSNDETCSQLVRSYEKNHSQIRRMDSPNDLEACITSNGGSSMPCSAATLSTKCRKRWLSDRCTQYRSHYLLQIEPCAHLPS